MDELNQDVQIVILSYLEPNDVMRMYSLFETIINELSTHVGFVVNCTDYVDLKTRQWFQDHHIHLKLLEKNYAEILGEHFWMKNFELHRDDDLPAIVYENGDQYWYQNDKLHRDNDLPAIVCSNGIKRWFEHGKERKFR
jgi:hypothetical protein